MANPSSLMKKILPWPQWLVHFRHTGQPWP